MLARRYKRVASGEMPLPDLILIDGGKGQVNAAAAVLQRLGIHSGEVELLGLAKGRSERRGRIRRKHNEDCESVVRPNQKNEIRLPRTSEAPGIPEALAVEIHAFLFEAEQYIRNQTREVSASAKALSRAERQTVARLDSSRWSAKIS